MTDDVLVQEGMTAPPPGAKFVDEIEPKDGDDYEDPGAPDEDDPEMEEE